MRNYTDDTNLPLIIKTIRERNLEGALVVNLNQASHIRLFFAKGQLVEVRGDTTTDQDVYKLLDTLLKGQVFQMYWQIMPVSTAEANISQELFSTFLQVLEMLTENGLFRPVEKGQLKGDFFGASTFPKSALFYGKTFNAFMNTGLTAFAVN